MAGLLLPRPYQLEAKRAMIRALKDGDASLVVMPTGSGKSFVLAEVAATAVRKALKVAIIAPSLELVEQDAAAAIGATTTEAVTRACAGIGPVDLSGRIVVATAGSIVRREIPAFDLLLIDEAHRFSTADETMLGKIVSQLREKNPQVMIGGLTATPFRGDGSPLLGNGGRFSKIAYQVGYIELVQLGFLAPIVAPKAPIEEFDLKNVRVRAGEYDPRDLATRFGDKRKTEAIAVAVAQYAADRNSIIVFAINVQHAHDMATALCGQGVGAVALDGSVAKPHRRKTIDDFRTGKIKALVSCDLLLTGFDAPRVDMIVHLRPTRSPVVHVQSVGRGTRIAPGKRDCLVLDFAGNFARLGPFDDPQPAPKVRSQHLRRTIVCRHCQAIVGSAATECPICKGLLHEPKPREDGLGKLGLIAARTGLLRGASEPRVARVIDVKASEHKKFDKPSSLRVDYTLDDGTKATEWFCCWHAGFTGTAGYLTFADRFGIAPPENAGAAARWIAHEDSREYWPASISVYREGDFDKIMNVTIEAIE